MSSACARLLRLTTETDQLYFLIVLKERRRLLPRKYSLSQSFLAAIAAELKEKWD
jgi:hypothetical protein